MEKFLELLQDYCLHSCLTCHHDSTATSEGNSTSLQERHHLLMRPLDRSDMSWDKDMGCLYHSHSVVSAILSAKQLVMTGSMKKGGGGGTPRMAKPPTLVTLSKEDNSGRSQADQELAFKSHLMVLCVDVFSDCIQHDAVAQSVTSRGNNGLSDGIGRCMDQRSVDFANKVDD